MPRRVFDKGGAEEPAMERLVRVGCAAMGTPIGLLSILGEKETLFRAIVGLDLTRIESDLSVTRRLVEAGPGTLMVIEDGATDPRVSTHPLVTGPEQLRFYAGATVADGQGRAVGSIAFMAQTPRDSLSAEEESTLRGLAALAGDLVDQAAAARLQTEQVDLLRLTEQMSGVGQWRFEIGSGRVTWSDGVYRIHGLDRETFDPSYGDVLASYHPDDRLALAALVDRAVATGEGYGLKARITRADGSERIVTAQAQTVRDGEDRTTSVFGVFQDITEQEEALSRLQRSEARYRFLADNMGDVITRIRPGGVVVYVSPAIEALTGFSREELSSKPANDMVHPEDHTRLQATMSRGLGGVQDQRLEYRLMHKDGHSIWVEGHFRAVRDEQGGTRELVAVIRDISARKTLEAELMQALDKAEGAARAKADFLANMSHELRTPLTSVIGFTGLLKDSGGLSETQQRFADRIGTASESLLGVINDILDYSKLEAEAVDLDPTPFEPRRLAEAAMAIVERQAEAKSLTLVVEADAALPGALIGDEGRLRQVAVNFLSNAVKFTEAGEVRLRLGWREGRMRVEVIDTGIGAAPDKIAGLFDRFSQADNSTTRVYGGTGLGLAISRRLIKMMGGEIGAHSEPGQGSTFWFELPLEAAADDALAPVGATDVTADAPRGLRLLMADDASANRELVAAMLGAFDIVLETAEDGVQALEAARSGRFEAILMDVHMPLMDGLDATRAIRALEGPAGRVPIIALTANVQPEQVERCRAAGMDGHVGKPIRLQDLITAIAEVTAGDTRDEAAA